MNECAPTIQETLFDFADTNAAGAVSRNVGPYSDPAFASNKSFPVHRWVPWVAGCSREFVVSALDKHLAGRSTVLDPFAGVGTTLVEAVVAGHEAVGFEINPFAVLASRTKASAHRIRSESLRDMINRFWSFYSSAVDGDYVCKSEPPHGFRTRGEFYSPAVLHKVLIVNDFINHLRQDDLRDVFRLAFAATMISYSNYSYEPSLSRRVSAGKQDIHDFPVGETVLAKLREMETDVAWMREHVDGTTKPATVFNESFFTAHRKVDTGTVDLVVTSPPYLNNYHYNRNTRPHLYWLGYANGNKDLSVLERQNFGKYWQTVRNSDHIGLDETVRVDEIAECISQLRSKNTHKGVYGGNGWANYAATYFNDCARFVISAKRTLRRRGTALVVIGNSILQGVMIPTDRYLAKIADSHGLSVVDIHIPRSTRVGNSIIRSDVRVHKAETSHHLYEAVVELRKR